MKGICCYKVREEKIQVRVRDMLHSDFTVGNEVQPVVTQDLQKARSSLKGKIKMVEIQVEDHDLLNFITGG